MAYGLVAMATNFLNLGTKNGMQKMDELLAQQNYISGAEPCKDDLAIYGALNGVIEDNHVNIIRWYNQIKNILGSQFLREGKGVTITKTTNDISIKSKESTQDIYNVNFDLPQLYFLNEKNDNDSNLSHEEIDGEIIIPLSSSNALKQMSIQDHSIKKSLITLHIIPWEDEKDLEGVEKHVRGIQMDGLFWGDSHFVTDNSGTKKLEITMTIDTEKVSPQELIGNILGHEPSGNLIQSCDIISFDKI